MIDSYAAWCGPCKAIVSSFKRLKNELGDDLLVFATVSIEHVFFIFHTCSEHAVMEIDCKVTLYLKSTFRGVSCPSDILGYPV